MKRSCLSLVLLSIAACSGGDDGGGDSGAGGSGGSAAGSGGTSGAGGSAAGTGGSSGAGGTAGSAGSTAGSGGTGGDAGSGGTGGTGGGGATSCVAPTPSQDNGNDCPSGEPVALKATRIATGLAMPTFVTHAPGDSDRLFVTERGGRIVVIDAQDGAELGDFLDVQNVATSSGGGDERGLLGLSFHPSYPNDPRFFVNYTSLPPVGSMMTKISSFEVSDSDPNAADPDSEQVLLDFDQPADHHNGGMLAFGPDGCLFIAAGDGGMSGQTAQSFDTELGKILRMDVDAPMDAPPGNFSQGSIPHIWDYGVRNPWRFSFDRQTGDLYIADVGEQANEEIDVEPVGTGSKNYGWPITQGNECRNGGTSCDRSGIELAVDEYTRGGENSAIIGGYVYRGANIPSLQGWYVYGDHGSGHNIRAFVWDGEGRCNDTTLDLRDRDNIMVDGSILSFGEDADGELYVTTRTSVYRIDPQ